jgi:hypothetical protein
MYYTVYRIFIGKPDEKRNSKVLGLDERMMLECMLEKQGGNLWTGFFWLRIGTSDGLI